jgi:hypothetical protein
MFNHDDILHWAIALPAMAIAGAAAVYAICAS